MTHFFQAILACVASTCGVTVAEMQRPNRGDNAVAEARAVAAYVAGTWLWTQQMSAARIGRAMCNRDGNWLKIAAKRVATRLAEGDPRTVAVVRRILADLDAWALANGFVVDQDGLGAVTH